MSTKKRGLFSRKPHAAPAVVEVPASPAPSSTSTTTPIASWPTSPSPPLPSDSQGIFPPRANSSTWNSVGGTLGDHNGSAGGVTEDGRKVSMEGSQRLNRSGSQKSTDAGEKHHGGMRSFFGRNKRSTLPAQPREVPSGIPVPVKSGGMPRSQSSGVLSNSTRGDEQQVEEQNQRPSLRSPASHNTQLSYSSPSLNFTPASPTHPRIRAHHEEQARLAAAAAGLPSPNSFTTPARSPLSPTSTPLPFSPASSHFSQALAPYDDSGSLRSRSDGITPGSTPTSSRRTPLPTPSPTGEPALSPLFTSTPLVSSSPSANRSPTYGNTLPSSPSTLAPPFRVRVFIDHPTTEPLYITVNPGSETLRSLKHKILRVDNERFVQFRQARRPPVETKWDIHPTVGEGEEGRAGRAGDKTFDFDRRIQLFRVSVDWLVVSKTKRNYEKTRTFQSVLSSHPSTPIVTSSETDFLPLLNLFPATPASAAARLKGLIEIVVRIVPAERESVPVLVSFSDMPDQPVVVDVEKGWTVHAVKEAIGKARGLAVRIVGGGRSQLGGEDFFLFKASQPRHTSTPLPYDIDHFEGLAPETLFDDEDQEFATHPFVVEAGLDLPERLLRRVELVAFLIADMEEDFRDGLKMKTHHVNDTTLRAGYDYGVSPATAIMNNARHVSPNRMDPARPSSRGSNNSSVNSGKRPTRDPRDARENGNGDRNGNGSHHHHRGDPRDQREQQQQQQRSPRTSPSTRSPHGLPSPPFSSGSSSERHHSHQQQPSYSSSSSSRNPQQQQQQHHSQQPSPQQYQQQQQQQASSYEKQLRQHQQQQQQAAEISPPITPSGSLHQVTAPRNVPKVDGSYTPPASFSPTTSPLGSSNRNFDSSSSEPGPPSPSSYKTALANAEDWVSPRLISNLASHQRSPDLDPVEHSSTFDGLEDVLKSYEGGSSAGSLGLSDAGGLDGLKQMLEKARSGSVEEERKQEMADVEAAGEEGEEKQEEMERRHEEIEEEERDCVDPHWTRSPGGGLSLGPVVEEDEPLSPASSTFGAKLKQPNHSRTSSSSSSTTSPLLLVHIRKPYAGPFTDTTSFASDDISPTSCPIPLPPIHPTRNASDASDYSQTSFATTPESPARVVRQGSSLPNGSEVDRSGNTSPIGSERTVVPSHPSARNLSTSSSDDDRSTVQPPSPAAVAQRFRFASIEATSVPPRTNSPTRIKYAHSMAANNRRGSTNRKGSYVIREGLATGYPLRSALKGGKAKAKAARPVASVVRRVSSRDIALNGRNISLNGGRNSILLGTNSPTKRNSFLVGSGRFPSNVRTGSNSSLRTSISSSAGTTSPKMTNGVNGGAIHSILRKPTPQSPNLNNGDGNNDSVDLASLPPSPAQSPPPQEFDGDRSFSRMGSMCAEGYAVIGGAMFSVTLRPMDEKGAMVMGTREFKAAGPLFKLESAH